MTILSSLTEEDVKLASINDPSWLAEQRLKSFNYYNTLPDEVSSLYNKYSGVSMLKPSLIHLEDHKHEPPSSILERVKEVRGITILQIGGQIYSIKPSNLNNLIIESINEALRKHEDLIRPILNRIDPAEDKFLSLENALFDSGLFIYVPKGMDLKEPITIIHALPEDGTSTISRNLFYVSESSRVSIVQELYSSISKDLQQTLFELQECYVAQNAEIEMVTIQAMSENSVNISNRKFYISKDGRMNSYLGLFGSALSRYKIDNLLEGEGASAEHMEVIFGSNSQAFDITSNMIHMHPLTRGRILSKSIMRDNAKSLFKGMIKIGKNAKGSESYLAGHAILLDRGAKADAIPSLEIENNEVKATHSASVAQMDEDQIFYLMNRGFDRNTAKRFIVFGFVEPLLRRLSLEARAWTNYLIESKWSGKPLMIRSDEAMKEILEVEEENKRIETDIFEKHYKYR